MVVLGEDDMEKLAKLEKFLWEDRDLVVVIGDIAPLLQGREEYNTQYKISEPDAPEAGRDVDRLMAGAALAQMVAQDGESTGWTLKLPGKNYGLFAAAEPEGFVCARAITSISASAEPKVVVQKSRSYGPLFESFVVPSSSDPIKAIEDYFSDAEQVATIIECHEPTRRGLLIRALPGGNMAGLAELSSGELFDTIETARNDDKFSFLSEIRMFYGCRCNEQMMLDLFLSLPAEKRQELTTEDGMVYIECPRCGRVYEFSKV